MSEEENLFMLSVKKVNPKPNPKEYHLKTIDDIFQILTPKNINRFMKEFKMGMKLSVLMREALKEKIRASHPEKTEEELNHGLSMPAFKWTDD